MKQYVLKRCVGFALIAAMLLTFLPGVFVGSVSAIDALTETKSLVSSKTSYSVMSGVTEYSATLDSGDSGYMLQIAPSAKVTLKTSYSGYFTEGSTLASRTAAASSLTYTKTTTTGQAEAYESATGRDVIFATNANFFNTSTYEPRGYLMVEGNEIHANGSDCICYFAVMKDGSYDIRAYTEDTSNVYEAVAGRQWLVRNGALVTQNDVTISARTVIGLKADGTVVVFVVDGKTNASGVTIQDMSELMYSLGCVEAINLDGGGSSTFATQRSGSSDLVIRNNPSDSNGERAVVSSLLLVEDPEADHLLFDFTNNTEAQTRYAKNIYGGLNYDTEGWHYHHSYSTAPAFDNAAGTLSFSTTTACPTDRNIHPIITSSNTSYTGGHPLSYVPGENDYFRIRMKIENSPDTAVNFRLMYASDDGTGSTGTAFSCTIPASSINNGYFTLEGAVDFKGVDTVTAIRPEVYNLLISDPASTQVTFTIDYIYVGPEPEDSLFFDFTNNAAARDRYEDVSYGGYNFDLEENGYWATGYNGSRTAYQIDNAEGVLHLDVTEGYSASSNGSNLTYGPWLKVTNTYGVLTGQTTYDYYPLNYDPANAEFVQLRFKLTNCEVPEGKTPRAVLEYYYTKDGTYAYANDIAKSFTFEDGVYQTLVIPVSSKFTSADLIECFGFRFQNIKSSTGGKLTIDYIYIGTENDLPTQDHLFFDFTNTEADQERYSSKTYGETNFDTTENWNRGCEISSICQSICC